MSRADEIFKRIHDEADYIIKNKCTIRECAKVFGVAKSTTHKDMKQRLPKINKNLHYQVYIVLRKNFNEKHIRGGASTRRKMAEIYGNSASA